MLFGKRTNLFGLDIGSNALKLAEIQKRCSDLLQEPDTLELTLEEEAPAIVPEGADPYNRG